MASTYSQLKIELIGIGDQDATWGSTTNTNLGTTIEEAIVGRATATFTTDADLTITLTNTNATQVARNYILNVVSAVSLSQTRNLIVPSINKPYIIENNTTGGQSVLVKTSAGTGVTVPNGRKCLVYADSINVTATDYFPAVYAAGLYGSNLTTGRVVFTTSNGQLTDASNFTFNGTTLAVPALTVSGTTTINTSISGLLKAASGVISAASVGADYLGPTSGSTLLAGNGTGGIKNITVGSGLGFDGTNLFSTSSGGSVTSVSVVSANGLAGTVANPSSTPAITLSTTVSGLVKGNGTALSAAIAGTDYLAPAAIGVTVQAFSSNLTAFAGKTAPTGVVVGTTDTQTLTNKRITDRVIAAGTSSGSITATSDTADIFTALGLTGAITLAVPSGTPTNGQKLILRIRDNGTSRAISWTTSSGGYRAIGVSLPAATTANKLLYIGCIYNSTDSYWDVVAVSEQA